MTQRTLSVGSTDDVWTRLTSPDVLTSATCQVRTFKLDAVPGAWGAPIAEEHPDANTIRVAARVVAAVIGTYAMQTKMTLGPLVIIKTVYFSVNEL